MFSVTDHYWQTRKTVMENLPFERFRFLKLLEFKQWKSFLWIGKILKQKWHKTTKNDMLKLTYIKALWKYLSPIASTACHFRALKSNASLNLNLMIRFRSRIILFRIQEMALELCTQQSAVVTGILKKVNN